MWARVKGRTENDIMLLPFSASTASARLHEAFSGAAQREGLLQAHHLALPHSRQAISQLRQHMQELASQ